MTLQRRELLALLAAPSAWAGDCSLHALAESHRGPARSAIYAVGNGEARFSNLRYRAIE